MGDGGLGFNLVKLEERMKSNKAQGKGSILAIGFGEVNTSVLSSFLPLASVSTLLIYSLLLVQWRFYSSSSSSSSSVR